jgi:hypothetical protein
MRRLEMLRGLEAIQPSEAEFAAFTKDDCVAATNAAPCLMSFAFKCLRPGQVFKAGFPCAAKQSINSIVSFGRACSTEHRSGFIDITLSVCIFQIKRGKTLQHADVPLGDQCNFAGSCSVGTSSSLRILGSHGPLRCWYVADQRVRRSGSAGLRIGEALGLEIDKHISPDFLTISIEQKARHCQIEERLKTAAALRKIDLHPTIAGLLKEFVGERRTGFLFRTRNGKPLGSSNILRRHLDPALKQMKYINSFTGTHKAGNHAFRRFRNTYLRNHTECPQGLQQYWMGHAGENMTDLYEKIKEDVAFRRKWAEKCGFGFELPSDVPNVPTIDEKDGAANAA